MPRLFAAIPKRNLVFFAALAAILLVLFYTMVEIPSMARARIETLLESAGFQHAKVTYVSVRPTGLRATNIKLDEYGYDEIKLFDADINWLAFFTTGKVSGVTIKGINLSRQSSDLSSSGRQLVSGLTNLPDYRLAVTDAIVDMGTDFGEIKIKADININDQANAKGRTIKAHITSDQYQLGFDSTWDGTLDDQGKLELSADIQDGRLNIGPMRISRFNGWFDASVGKDGYKVQSQMEAGSAAFMGIPLHNISLINDHNAVQNSVIFRSGLSGMPDVLYTADFMENDKGEMFTSILKGENLGRFLRHINEQTKKNKTVPAILDKSAPFEFKSQFQPDRRFVGGPLPFSLEFGIGDAKQAGGNILFYPDTYDVRGSIETNTGMATALESYFDISAANIKQNFIRLDGSARNFFHLKEDDGKKEVSQ